MITPDMGRLENTCCDPDVCDLIESIFIRLNEEIPGLFRFGSAQNLVYPKS